MSVCLELAKFRPINHKILMNLMWGWLWPELPAPSPLCIACSAPSWLFKPLLPQLSLAFFLSAVVWGYCCWGRELHEPLIKYPASIWEGAGKSKAFLLHGSAAWCVQGMPGKGCSTQVWGALGLRVLDAELRDGSQVCAGSSSRC